MKSQLDFEIGMMYARGAHKMLLNDNYLDSMERVEKFFSKNPIGTDGKPFVVTMMRALIGQVQNGEISKGEAFEQILWDINLFTE